MHELLPGPAAPDRLHGIVDAEYERMLPDLRADGQLVMELKFDHAIPRWRRDVVAANRLRLDRFSKYAAGLQALQRGDYRCAHAVLEHARAMSPAE